MCRAIIKALISLLEKLSVTSVLPANGKIPLLEFIVCRFFGKNEKYSAFRG